MKTIHLALILAAAALVAAAPAAEPVRLKPAMLSKIGTLIFRNRSFLPIGLYHVNHTAAEYALLAAHGFNTVQGSFANGPEFKRTLDLAQTYNLAVSVPLYAGSRVNLDATLAKVRAYDQHPAVLQWKVFDEPDADRWATVRPEVITACRALTALRPVRPIELTLCKDYSFQDWTPLADALQVSRYPLPGRPLTEVSDYASRLRAQLQPWQHLAVVIQCGYTPDRTTQPSTEQARSMVYLALIQGAKGIHWYSRKDPSWDLTTTPLWPQLKKINAEIAALAPALLDGKPVTGLRVSSASIRTAAWSYGNKTYLLATNPTTAPLATSITLPNAAKLASPTRLGETASVPWSGGPLGLSIPGPGSVTVVFQNRTP